MIANPKDTMKGQCVCNLPKEESVIENKIERIPIYEEYRLIEKRESEVNGAWKGAHILLFFLTFVFGSFCTLCFHILMYLFDEKCILFPKLLSLSSMRQNVIYEFLAPDKDLPVDFLTTQWVDKSVCNLPKYVPLVSGIFGLVWTTIFLMCSSGSRTLTGLQRPWRVLPPVFVFSLAMGGLCIYTSTVTQNGLDELCIKLGEITGSSTCTYTINVATLLYERRIRGVYQATRLTIITAWLHTACWLCSAFLTILRVLLAVDFQLVCVRAELNVNIDKMLENHERQIRTVSPDILFRFEDDLDTSREDIPKYNTELLYKNKYKGRSSEHDDDFSSVNSPTDMIYLSSQLPKTSSGLSLVPAEQKKLARKTACKSLTKNEKFIMKLLYDIIDSIDLPKTSSKSSDFVWSTSSSNLVDKSQVSSRKHGEEQKSTKSPGSVSYVKSQEYFSVDLEGEVISKEYKRTPGERLNKKISDLPPQHETRITCKKNIHARCKSTPKMALELREPIQQHIDKNIDNASKSISTEYPKKSSLKSIGVQTDKKKKHKDCSHKVHISESKSIHESESHPSIASNLDEDKETQTAQKEKQD